MKRWMILLVSLLLMLCLTACLEENMEASGQGHAHSYTESVTKEAGCKTKGEKTLTCECGDSYTQVIPAQEHDYVEEMVQEPTCKKEGIRQYTCSRCNHSYKDKYAKKLPHEYLMETVEPTCAQEGIYRYTCSSCGQGYQTKYAEKLPHDYATEKTEPTCTAAGVCSYTCNDCGDHYKGANGWALGHSFVGGVCQRCGDINSYAYDLGTVIENPTEADFEIFYEMAKEMSPSATFTVADSDPAILLQYILEDDGPGLYHMFDFEHNIQTIGGVMDETTQVETPIFDVYLAQDVDWALKAIFDRDAKHFSQTDPNAGGNYYEGEYFYRFAGEHYKGNPVFWTTTFETQWEKLEYGFYKITVSIAWQNEITDSEGREPEVETGEYIAIPMHSEDMGTYWRIVSYTSLTP